MVDRVGGGAARRAPTSAVDSLLKQHGARMLFLRKCHCSTRPAKRTLKDERLVRGHSTRSLRGHYCADADSSKRCASTGTSIRHRSIAVERISRKRHRPHRNIPSARQHDGMVRPGIPEVYISQFLAIHAAQLRPTGVAHPLPNIPRAESREDAASRREDNHTYQRYNGHITSPRSACACSSACTLQQGDRAELPR